jgi:ribosomal protein S27AE
MPDVGWPSFFLRLIVSCDEGFMDDHTAVPHRSVPVRKDGLEAKWREPSEEVVSGMAEWRVQHPKATLQEIETALDEHLGRLRARMLEDAALASQATDLRDTEMVDRPRCPKCGAAMKHQSWEKRDLLTHHGHTVALERSYALCPTCGEAFFPPGR